MGPQTLASIIARTVQARLNCADRGIGIPEWFDRHTDRLETIALNILPSGSGFDSGTTIDLERSSLDRVVLNTAFHHMDQHGGYAGWSEHTITVRPSFVGLSLTISGRDRNGIKEYMHDVFHTALTELYTETVDGLVSADRMVVNG